MRQYVPSSRKTKVARTRNVWHSFKDDEEPGGSPPDCPLLPGDDLTKLEGEWRRLLPLDPQHGGEVLCLLPPFLGIRPDHERTRTPRDGLCHRLVITSRPGSEESIHHLHQLGCTFHSFTIRNAAQCRGTEWVVPASEHLWMLEPR